MLGLRERGAARLFALLLAVFAVNVQAESPAASTFFLEETETQFSVNLANDSADVNIYFTSPAYSWVAVGFGESMKNSLMLILYPNAKGDNVTVSPRMATGHAEPSFASGIPLDILDGTGINDDMFVLRARCRDCRVWHQGYIDAKNTAYPMIYAFGPGNKLQSNDPNAPLKRHVRYGKFTMNMVQATGGSGVPTASTASSGVELKGGMVKDHDRAKLAHAVMGCIALFVFWPLNVIFAGFFRNIRIHVYVSGFIMVFLVISYALGISTSSEYNRSKSFNSPHQIMAFITLLPILSMSILPIRPIAALHSMIPRLHTPLTSLTFTLLVLTGGLGLHLASSPTPIILAYVSVTLIVFVCITLIQLCIRRRGSAYARATTRRRLGEEDEQDFGLAQYYAKRKLVEEESSRSPSASSLHGRSGSANSQQNLFGGGTMPGPQYLLNMHPGVPVHFK